MHGFALVRRTAGRFGVTRLALGIALTLGGVFVAQVASAENPAPMPTLANTKPYTVEISKVSSKRGQAATVKVVFRPAKGWHVNTEFPTELKLTLPDGVTAPKAALKKPDAKLSEQEGSFDVVLTGTQPGKKTVAGDLRFAVCTPTTCDPQRTPVSIELNVE